VDNSSSLAQLQTMTNLSTAAEAILTAYENSPFEYDTGDFTACAAVLRAAASQFDRPKRSDAHALWNEGFLHAQNVCRADLLNIADELEGIKYGTYRCNLEDKPQ